MSFAILRFAKLKTWGNVGGSGAHTYRQQGMAPNADEVRLGKNRTMIGTPKDVLGDVKARAEQVNGHDRANGVKADEFLLTASPDFWKGKSGKEIEAWAKENIKFLKQRYGEKNIAHAVLHMDETSPHLVAYVVPEVDGKMNCRALLGDRQKCQQLQSDYATAMERFGLERGVKGSKARHKTIKAFYAEVQKVERQAAAEVKKLSEPTPPPERRLLQSADDRRQELEEWAKSERRKDRRLVQLAAQSVTATRTLAEQAGHLRQANARLSSEVDDLKAQLATIYEQMGQDKDQVGRLRKLDVSAVADRLGHSGEVKKGENAIDLVKRIGGFDFAQSVAWLHHEFGEEAAAAAVKDDLAVKPPARPFTPAENKIKTAVKAQLDALGCQKYRLSVIGNDDGAKPYLPGKHGSEERFFAPDDVVNMIPYLRYENNQGRNIFITPMDDHAHYVLLDDLRVPASELQRMGFQPCLVQNTSWERQQAVFKVSKSLDRRAVIDVFNAMNKRWGDEKITGLRHPFRLAGFRNMKPKHEREGKYPFATVVQAVNRFCTKTTELIRSAMAKADSLPSPSVEDQPPRRPK